MADQTANQEFSYAEVYYGHSLAEWVNLAHKELSLASGWGYTPLKPGMFGFDNMAMSIGHTFRSSKDISKLSVDQVAQLIHEGWVKNYVYWRDHKPSKPLYSAPAKPLGDDRRNLCASTLYQDLPQEEKDKDLVIATFLLKTI